jgi:hypothetical protein
MIPVDSGITRPPAPSRSTGNLPTGQIALNADADCGSPRSTCTVSNGVPVS